MEKNEGVTDTEIFTINLLSPKLRYCSVLHPTLYKDVPGIKWTGSYEDRPFSKPVYVRKRRRCK